MSLEWASSERPLGLRRCSVLVYALRGARDLFAQEADDRLRGHHPMSGIGNDAQLCARYRPEHLDGVLRRDDVSVAEDEECRRGDALQLLVREARLSAPHQFQTCENDGPIRRAVRRELRVLSGDGFARGIEAPCPLLVLGRIAIEARVRSGDRKLAQAPGVMDRQIEPNDAPSL